jgi:hypothetical protein
MHLAYVNPRATDVDFNRQNGFDNLNGARCYAGQAQQRGDVKRSVQIWRNGELVDLKRL